MPSDVWNLLIQIPIVVAFIYYTQYMNKQFTEYLTKQREAEREAIDQRRNADREIQRDMIATVSKLDESIQKHDAFMIAQMKAWDERWIQRKGEK